MTTFMKKILVLIACVCFGITSYGQYRWEVSGGPTFSNLSLGDDTDSEVGTGFYINAGYGYLTGVRARTSFVFSLDLLQRSSEVTFAQTIAEDGLEVGFSGTAEVKVLQIGFNPKFRYLFNTGKDRFRPFLNVGPSFRLNTKVEIGETELEDDAFEQLVIGGVYGAGFSQMVGEMFDIFGEAGVMNDFTDNLTDQDSKFFDFYLRLGVRFRIYDARR